MASKLETSLTTEVLDTSQSDESPATIICVFCSRVLQDPKILDCLHSFCCNCLTRTFEVSCLTRTFEVSSTNLVIECPSCAHLTVVPEGDVTNIPSNVYLKRVLDYRDVATDTLNPSSKCSNCSANAKHRCMTCKESVCNQHKTKHTHEVHKVRPLNDVLATIHRTKVDSGVYDVIFCQKHKEWSKYYCQQCSVLMCEHCHRTEHKFHPYTDPKDEGKLVRRIIAKRFEKMKEKELGVLDRRKQIDLNLQKIDLAENETITKLEKARDALIEEICQRHKTSEVKVKEIFSESRTKFVSDSEWLSRTSASLSESLNAVETYVKHALDEEMLILQSVLSNRLTSLESEVDDADGKTVICDIPAVTITSTQIENDIFQISRNSTQPTPQKLEIKKPKAKFEDKKLSEKANGDLTVKGIHKLVETSCTFVTDICWMNRSQIAVADHGQGKIVVFDSNGKWLWDRSYDGVQNVAFVKDVVVCDSVDAVYPFTKDTKYHRIYVSTKNGPFPVAKSVRCDKIYAGSINEKQIKVYKKDGKKDSVITLQRPFSPSMMALDSNQNIIAIEGATKSVFKISSSGCITSFFSPSASEIKIWNPSGICIDTDDQTYIANKGNDSLIWLSRNGKLVHTFLVPFPEPRGLSIGLDRKFISADSNGVVWCFSIPQ